MEGGVGVVEEGDGVVGGGRGRVDERRRFEGGFLLEVIEIGEV